MRLNKAGFTTIELLLSFSLVIIIVIAMFDVIMNYKNKEQLSSMRNDLLAYKLTLTKDIQDDCMKRGVSSVSLVNSRMITIRFQDGSSKSLTIANDLSKITYGSLDYALGNLQEVLGAGITETTFFRAASATGANFSTFHIDIPIKHPDFDEDFGVHILIVVDSASYLKNKQNTRLGI